LQFQAHRVEDLNQAGDVYIANVPPVQEEPEVDRRQSAEEQHLVVEQDRRQVGTIQAGLRHDNLQGSTHATEIRGQASQIDPKNPASLDAEFDCHGRRETRLRKQGLDFFTIEEAQHGTIVFNGKFLDPFGGDREAAYPGTELAKQQHQS